MSPAQPCRYLRVSTFYATFDPSVRPVDRTHCFWRYLYAFSGVKAGQSLRGSRRKCRIFLSFVCHFKHKTSFRAETLELPWCHGYLTRREGAGGGLNRKSIFLNVSLKKRSCDFYFCQSWWRAVRIQPCFS